MATNNYLYPAPYTCVSNASYTRTRLIPKRTDCVPMNLSCGWLGNTEDAYNCNLCGSDIYFCRPYEAGDKIQLQTQMADTLNALPLEPVYGWADGVVATPAFQAQLYDMNDNLISSDVQDFCSRYFVGVAFGQEKTIQGLELDTTLIAALGVDCFYLRVNSFVDFGAGLVENNVIYSEPFCVTSCNDKVLAIKGEWDGFDCCGNWHGEIQPAVGDAFEFDNTYKYYATLAESGTNVTKTYFVNNVTETNVVSLYEIQLDRPIAPFYKSIFANSHYAAKRLFVNGEEFKANSNISNRLGRETKMWLFDAEIYRECKKDFYCL